MRTPLCHAFVALALLGAADAVADSAVPSSAKLRTVPASIARGDARIKYAVSVSASGSDYYVFPTFRVTKAEFATADSAHGRFAEWAPLFGLDGKSAVPYCGDARAIRIRITAEDPLAGDDEQAIYDALAASTDRFIHSKERQAPDLDEHWRAVLSVRDLGAGGAEHPLGIPFEFTRSPGEDRQTFTFNAPLCERDYYNVGSTEHDLLALATGADLHLDVLGTYQARFDKTDFSVTGEFMDSAVHDIVAKVTSKAGDQQAVLFVPLGGDSKESTSFSTLFRRAMTFSIEHRSGGPAADVDLIKVFLDRSMTQFEQQIKVQDISDTTVVSFLLSNGIRITTPMGELKKISDHFKTDTETKITDSLDEMSKTQTGVKVGFKGDLDVLGIIDLGGSTNVEYSSLDEKQRKSLHEDFRHDLKEIDKLVDGTMPIVTTMNLDQMRRVATEGFFKTRLEQSTFEEGTKEFRSRMALSDPALRAAAGPSAAYKRQLGAAIDIVRHDMAGFAGASFNELGSGAYAVDWPREVGMTVDILDTPDQDQAAAAYAGAIAKLRASLLGWDEREGSTGVHTFTSSGGNIEATVWSSYWDEYGTWRVYLTILKDRRS